MSVLVPPEARPRGSSPRLCLSTLPLLVFLPHSLRPYSACLSLTVNFPKVLQCLNITVLSREKCQESYPGQIDDTMFCAGDEAGRDSCQVRTVTSLLRRQTHTER